MDTPSAIFSVDPLTPMPHDVNVKAQMRPAIVRTTAPGGSTTGIVLCGIENG